MNSARRLKSSRTRENVGRTTDLQESRLPSAPARNARRGGQDQGITCRNVRPRYWRSPDERSGANRQLFNFQYLARSVAPLFLRGFSHRSCRRLFINQSLYGQSVSLARTYSSTWPAGLLAASGTTVFTASTISRTIAQSWALKLPGRCCLVQMGSASAILNAIDYRLGVSKHVKRLNTPVFFKILLTESETVDHSHPSINIGKRLRP
jgi:hypothetical protein